jgi:two-component system, OmpR family, phosphate regulon response regulator PhoB
MPANILVVEDEPAIQELLALNITQAGHNAIRALSVEHAQELLRNTLPDLILLDWMLPGMSGIEFARRLKSETLTKSIPIIMLTARGDEYDKVRGLEVGADDYVTKPFSPRELNARIKAVLRRRAPQMTDDPIEILGLTLDPSTHRVVGSHMGNSTNIELGPTEFRLLHFFMSNAERVHTRSQLLDKVWGDRVFVEDRTVDVHIRRLRNCLSISGHQDLIQTVRGSGYRLSSVKES